nr:uncharacterized protein LOC109170786 [Ipomoea batatas]
MGRIDLLQFSSFSSELWIWGETSQLGWTLSCADCFLLVLLVCVGDDASISTEVTIGSDGRENSAGSGSVFGSACGGVGGNESIDSSISAESTSSDELGSVSGAWKTTGKNLRMDLWNNEEVGQYMSFRSEEVSKELTISAEVSKAGCEKLFARDTE